MWLSGGVRGYGGVTRLVGARWCGRMQGDLAEQNSKRYRSLILLSYHSVPMATWLPSLVSSGTFQSY